MAEPLVTRALLVVAVVGGALMAAAAATAGNVVVRASVDPAAVGLGEPFDYTVEVHGPSGMTVFADVAPFVAAGPPGRSRSDGGKVVRIEQRLLCLDRACAPGKHRRTVSLPRVRVTGAGAQLLGAAASVDVVPRVPERAVTAARARYRVDDQIRATDAPWSAAAGILAALAVASVALAALLLVRGARRRPSTSAAGRSRPGGIAHALRLLRESARRPVPDRRRAADNVARTVGHGGRDAAAEDARRIAWSAPDPQPQEVVALADRVESTTGSST